MLAQLGARIVSQDHDPALAPRPAQEFEAARYPVTGAQREDLLGVGRDPPSGLTAEREDETVAGIEGNGLPSILESDSYYAGSRGPRAVGGPGAPDTQGGRGRNSRQGT